jgi:hypothetical protein
LQGWRPAFSCAERDEPSLRASAAVFEAPLDDPEMIGDAETELRQGADSQCAYRLAE